MSKDGSGLTCVTCCVRFTDTHDHKLHFQTDWHRFNIHRSLDGLPPVTLDVYETTMVPAVLARQQQQEEIKDRKKGRKRWECRMCRRLFASQAALDNHVRSEKHIEPSESGIRGEHSDSLGLQADLEVMGGGEESARIIDPKEECIFCSHRFPDLESTLQHMTEKHSLFIPDLEYVADLVGLLEFLAVKVSAEHRCLYCSSCDPEVPSAFHGLMAVRKHMIDKGHTKIRFDDQGCWELSPFYNWDSLYSSPMDYAEATDTMNVDNSEDWEDVEDSESAMGELRGQKTLLVSPDGSELMLPNGAMIGNREYRRYFRQHLASPEIAKVKRQLLADYRQRGQSTALVPTERALLERSQRTHQTRSTTDSLAVSIKQNKLQPHFRLQIR
jgi:pre-60S factor REI1